MAKFSRRHFVGLTAAGLAAGLVAPRFAFADGTATATPAPTAAATATAGPLPPAPAPGPIDLKAAGGMDALIAAAKKENLLAVITLPDDWSNYGEVKKTFLAKY